MRTEPLALRRRRRWRLWAWLRSRRLGVLRPASRQSAPQEAPAEAEWSGRPSRPEDQPRCGICAAGTSTSVWDLRVGFAGHRRGTCRRSSVRRSASIDAVRLAWLAVLVVGAGSCAAIPGVPGGPLQRAGTIQLNEDQAWSVAEARVDTNGQRGAAGIHHDGDVVVDGWAPLPFRLGARVAVADWLDTAVAWSLRLASLEVRAGKGDAASGSSVHGRAVRRDRRSCSAAGRPEDRKPTCTSAAGRSVPAPWLGGRRRHAFHTWRGGTGLQRGTPPPFIRAD